MAYTGAVSSRNTQPFEADGTDVENLLGSEKGDKLSGDAGPSALDGDEGDDVLDGRGGNDVLEGGADDDTASFANAPVA